MKLIELTQGRVAIVDDEDFEWLSEWVWFYQRSRKTGYAKRNACSKLRQMIPMQVAIMKRYKRWKRGREIDHINMCGVDNRKENLRLATLYEQSANGRLQINNSSKVTGVGWHERDSRWRARITIGGRLIHLGNFINKKDAITARRRAEIKYFGEYRHDPTKLCPLWKTGQCPDCSERAQGLGLKP